MNLDDKIKYSPLEQKILENIPEDGRRVSTIDLVHNVYPPGEAPRNARESILGGANSLIEKSDENQEPWELFKGKQRGNQPVYFWREVRVRKNDQNKVEFQKRS